MCQTKFSDYAGNIAQGDKDIFLKLFDNLKNNVKSKPDMLYKDYWK